MMMNRYVDLEAWNFLKQSFFFLQDNSLVHQIAIKDRQLILAAKCGKVLLEQKDELERQIDILNRDYQQRIDARISIEILLVPIEFSSFQTLEQERYELRLLLERIQSECETKIIESNEDKLEIRRQLDDLRREQRIHDEQQTQTIQELTEINLKLSQDLHIVSVTSFFFSLSQQIRRILFISNRVVQMNQDYKNN